MIAHLGRLLTAPVRRVAGAWRTTRRTVGRVPDVVDAVLVLPTLSRQLDRIGFATATLPEMHAEIARLRGDTQALVQIDRTLAAMAAVLERVEHNTAGVQELAEVVVPLRGAAQRVGRISARWPAQPVQRAVPATTSRPR